jgi:hypothetical protein
MKYFSVLYIDNAPREIRPFPLRISTGRAIKERAWKSRLVAGKKHRG